MSLEVSVESQTKNGRRKRNFLDLSRHRPFRMENKSGKLPVLGLMEDEKEAKRYIVGVKLSSRVSVRGENRGIYVFLTQ